jgi:RIO-like serine/threonine protein kinase
MKHENLRVLRPMKVDIFGKIELAELDDGRLVTIRNWRGSRLFARPVASILALREKRMLRRLESLEDSGIPKLLYFGKGKLIRSYIEGCSLKQAQIKSAAYYTKARKLIDRIHESGMVHNDLEKPENWLVTENGSPAIVDFQIAWFFPRKGAIYRLAAKEDIRHLIKQKSRFFPENLTEEERKILLQKSLFARIWNRTFKPVYHFVTRKLLHYSDRRNSKYSR